MGHLTPATNCHQLTTEYVPLCVGRRRPLPGRYRRERAIPVTSHCVTLAHDGRRPGLVCLTRVVLTRADPGADLVALRALISGTAHLEPNRAHAVDIAVTITRALERNYGDD